MKVRRSVDLIAEFSDVGVLSGGLEDGLLDRVGSGDQEGTVKEEKGDTVIETSNSRFRTSGETLALGLVGVVKENLKSGVLSNTETLGTFLSTVDPNDGTVSKKSSSTIPRPSGMESNSQVGLASRGLMRPQDGSPGAVMSW